MKRDIKVLSVCTSDSFGGAAKAAFRIHQAVKSYGIDSVMFVKNKATTGQDIIALEQFIPRHPFFRAINWFREKIENQKQHYLWRRYSKRSANYMSDLRSVEVYDALNQIDFDILHLHWINSRFLPLDKLPKDKPIVWTLHDSWPFCGICHYFLDCTKYTSGCGACPHLSSSQVNDLSRMVWKKKQKYYRDLDLHIVAPSRWLAECAGRSLLFKGRPISVIPNCLDTETFKPLSEVEIIPGMLSLKEHFLGKAIILIGAVSISTDRIKGMSVFIKALHHLEVQGFADRIGVIIFGSDELIEGLPTSIASFQTGYLKDVTELVSLYNIASVIVVPSFTEVFGQVASEAMSCGKPVVAFRCTGIQEVVDDDCGYLAEPYDSDDFARGIRWCLDKNQDGHLSLNARKKVLDRYSPTVVGKRYAELYQRLA